MAHLDLDQAKAARLEAITERHSFTYGGREFELPAELPAAVFIAQDQGVFSAGSIMAAIVGQDQWVRLNDMEPSQPDMEALRDWAMGLYGVESLPESPASQPSSEDDGGSSRPTSNGSTDATSPRGSGRRARASGPSPSDG